MAKPIEANPILRGKAAKEFREYLAKAKPDVAKAERNRHDTEIYNKVKVTK